MNDQINNEATNVEESVLDAMQKGFTKVGDISNYVGPTLLATTREDSREPDVPLIMRSIERLISKGYIEWNNEGFRDQLTLQLTDNGKDESPSQDAREEELVSEYGVSPDALKILRTITEYRDEHQSLPSMSQLQSNMSVDLLTYQIQPLYTQLIDAGLAKSKGLFRFKVTPTDKGQSVLDQYRREFAD